MQLIEAIFNEYANERSGVGLSASYNTAKVEGLAIYLTEKPTEEVCCMYKRKSLNILMGVCMCRTVLSYINIKGKPGKVK